MVDTRALLKGFGKGADVAQQIATDKAVNSRRVRAGTRDITVGQIVEVKIMGGTGTAEVPSGFRDAIPTSCNLTSTPGFPNWQITGTVLSVTFSSGDGAVTFWVF